MLRRLRVSVLGGLAACALWLAPDKASAQYYYYSYPSYGYYSPGYSWGGYYGYSPRYYRSYSYRPWRGSYWSGYRGYRPWYGYRRGWSGWGGFGYRYPRYSFQIGPFGYTRW